MPIFQGRAGTRGHGKYRAWAPSKVQGHSSCSGVRGKAPQNWKLWSTCMSKWKLKTLLSIRQDRLNMNPAVSSPRWLPLTFQPPHWGKCPLTHTDGCPCPTGISWRSLVLDKSLACSSVAVMAYLHCDLVAGWDLVCLWSLQLTLHWANLVCSQTPAEQHLSAHLLEATWCQQQLVNTYISHASNMCDFCNLTRIAKLNTHEFLEFSHYHNFICIEYQHL